MDAETTTQAVQETDSVLLGRYADSGDMEAFTALVKRHTQTVYGVCVRRLWKNTDLAEDATQMVFALLAGQAKELRQRSEVGSWLHKAAVFTVMRIRAKESRYEAMRSKYMENMNAADSNDQSEFMEQARDVLDVAIVKLSERYRQFVVMHYFQGLTYDQIAVGTGSPVSTVRTYLDRAREKLRAELTRLNVALTGPLLLQLLQNEGIMQAPAGLIEKCVNAARPGGGGGNTPDHKAILKDMTSAGSWSATVKAAIGVCAVVLGAAAVLVASRQEADGGAQQSVEQRVSAPAVQAESDIILQDDFRDGLAQWEVVEKNVGKDKHVPAGEAGVKRVQIQKIDGNNVLVISAPDEKSKRVDNIVSLGVRHKKPLPLCGYAVEWDVKRETAEAEDFVVGIEATYVARKFVVTNAPMSVDRWQHRKTEFLPVAPHNGVPRWQLDSHIDGKLVVSYELAFDITILQLEVSGGKALIDNLVVRRLPAVKQAGVQRSGLGP